MVANYNRARKRNEHVLSHAFLSLSDTEKNSFKDTLLNIGIMIAFNRPYVPYLRQMRQASSGKLHELYKAISVLNTQGIDKILSIYVK